MRTITTAPLLALAFALALPVQAQHDREADEAFEKQAHALRMDVARKERDRQMNNLKFRQKLLNHVTVDFNNTPLTDVTQFLQQLSGLVIVVTRDVTEAIENEDVQAVTLKAQDETLEKVLRAIALQSGTKVSVDRDIVAFDVRVDPRNRAALRVGEISFEQDGVTIRLDLYADDMDEGTRRFLIARTTQQWRERGERGARLDFGNLPPGERREMEEVQRKMRQQAEMMKRKIDEDVRRKLMGWREMKGAERDWNKKGAEADFDRRLREKKGIKHKRPDDGERKAPPPNEDDAF